MTVAGANEHEERVVAAGHRHSGLAERLVGAVIEGARAAGALVLQLTVTAGNAPAQRLYDRMGFQSYGTERRALRVGDRFQRGPWHLGRWSRPIGTIAVVWVVFITILFMLPTVSPVDATTFNYTPLAVMVVLGFAGLWWLVSAKNWFTGPKVQGTAEELAEVERDIELAGETA